MEHRIGVPAVFFLPYREGCSLKPVYHVAQHETTGPLFANRNGSPFGSHK